jgi:hypothetical protein
MEQQLLKNELTLGMIFMASIWAGLFVYMSVSALVAE